MNRFLERLAQGPVICAEGYLFEFERRGYLQAGAFVPEVVLEHPELVAQLHREFVHAGSDVVEAFTYYAHREKLRIVGKEDALEEINRQALRIAGEVARETGALLAGDICNTNIYDPADGASRTAVRAMFEEQVGLGRRRGRRLRHRRDLLVGRGGADGARRHQGDRTAGRHHARHPPRARDARGLDARGRLQAPRGRGRGRRRPQLHPRTAHDAAAARADPRHVRRAARRASGPVPDHATRSRPSSRSPTPNGPARGRSRPRSTRSSAPATSSASSPRPPTRWASPTWACAAARRRTTSARWPRRSAARRPRAATAPT